MMPKCRPLLLALALLLVVLPVHPQGRALAASTSPSPSSSSPSDASDAALSSAAAALSNANATSDAGALSSAAASSSAANSTSSAAASVSSPSPVLSKASPSPSPAAFTATPSPAASTASPSPAASMASPSPAASSSSSSDMVLVKLILRITGPALFPMMYIDSFVNVMNGLTSVSWTFRTQQAWAKEHPWPSTMLSINASASNCSLFYCPAGPPSSGSSRRRLLAHGVTDGLTDSSSVRASGSSSMRKLLQANSSSTGTCGTTISTAPTGAAATAAGCTAAVHYVVCGSGTTAEANCVSVCKSKTTADGTSVYAASNTDGSMCCKCLFNGGTPLAKQTSPSPSTSASPSPSPSPASSTKSPTPSPSPSPSPSSSPSPPSSSTVTNGSVWYAQGYFNGTAPANAGVFIFMDATVPASQLPALNTAIAAANTSDVLYGKLQKEGWNNITAATILYAAVPYPDFSGYGFPTELNSLNTTPSSASSNSDYALGFFAPGLTISNSSSEANAPKDGSTNVGMIVGIIAGVVGAALLAVLVWVVVASRRRRQDGKLSGDEMAARWKLERQLTEARSKELAREASRQRWAQAESTVSASRTERGGDPWARDAQQRAQSVSAARSLGSQQISWTRSMKQTSDDNKRNWLGLGKRRPGA